MTFFYFLYKKLIEPRSQNEDSARREFILNIFLIASIILLSFAVLSVISNSIKNGENYEGNSPVYVLGIWLFFVALLALSRQGFFKIASYVFVGVYFFAVSYGLYSYGIDQPQTLLGFALVIVISGVLVGSRFAFLTTILTAAVLITLGYLQFEGIYPIHANWKNVPAKKEDATIFSITLAIIAVASWLSNREIEKSLARARRSETELKHERDNLEITVEERTKELKEAQAERVAELYRFAEFGKLSSGLFHDLMNPLNAISLNIEKLKEQNNALPIKESASYVDRAITSAKKLQDLVIAVRKQMVRQEPQKVLFSLNDEMKYVLDVLSHKAMKANVTLRYVHKGDVEISGDPIKFNQIALNLVANAIDAYASKDVKNSREVLISLNGGADKITLQVKDNGSGISKENIARIFEPFFTTKAAGQGMGIGLSMTKHMVEKDFGGHISVSSKEGEGTTFTVELTKHE
ncbi:MAG: hypothetical protein A3B23_01225 [Candidatus Colwellbacteria bacterium RIFCSPLOWO2_01_FULL_48_10]|uniref:histidine kinase n=1 Tax=Candidatus Colwellbacteria bacterium RIFCSPLOWO2_01_FULL_48_10 TaxID=1797690 RepID=A0A1G1Z544_9BACT|nr:MAG: hypothetical protein A3B23_01225 [Candidatus Colwellbacteria bacterium RIFCSPLOWO2_01_FULL_48_10]